MYLVFTGSPRKDSLHLLTESLVCTLLMGRHDIQHNGIQHNDIQQNYIHQNDIQLHDTQHTILNCDAQNKRHSV